MRLFTLYILMAGLLSSVAFATVPVPTNLTVVLMHDANGQYFRISFRKLALNSDSGATIAYGIVRWKGRVPDTTARKSLGSILQSGDTMGVYDDHSSIFNLLPSDSGYSPVYSYSVYAVRRDTLPRLQYSFSELATPVVGTLDSASLHFTETASSQTAAHTGDTVHGTFKAVEGNASAVIHYFIYSVSCYPSGGAPSNASASAGIDSVTGVFWATENTPITVGSITVRIAVHAVDDAGRMVESRVYLAVAAPQEGITLYLSDAAGALHAGTRCYIGLFAANPSDSTHQPMYTYGSCDSNGRLSLKCASGIYKLRVSAEGYIAQWVNDANGNSTISASGSVRLTMTAAQRFAFSGHVTGVNNKGLVGVTIKEHRAWGPSRYHWQIGSTTTDQNGAYTCSIPAGDSLLNTYGVFMEADASGYVDSVQYFDHTNYSSKTLIAVDSDRSNINFSFSTVASQHGDIVVYLKGVKPDSSILNFMVQLSIYQLQDSGFVLYGLDTLTNGRLPFTLPNGKYIFFAQPSDTAHLSGYYKRDAFAATWQEADTVAVTGPSRTVLLITLARDTTAALGAGGSPIDGFVSNGSGVIGNAHLLLYKAMSSPAGSAITLQLVKATVTSSIGSYSFPHVPVGIYEIDVDVVGREPYRISGIFVDETGREVKKDITVGVSAVESGMSAMPIVPILAQNYPNPFSASTTIAFTLSMPNEMVDLTIYDIGGRQIRQLVHGNLEAGQYRVDVREQLRPGVYTCVLRTGGFIKRTLMTVIR